MSKTPIFDTIVKSSDPDLYKASTVFPQPSTHWSSIPVDPRYYGKVTGEFPDVETERLSFKASINKAFSDPKGPEFGYPIIPAPESTWKIFLRCLGWWKP